MKTASVVFLLLIFSVNVTSLRAEKLDPKIWGGVKITVLDADLSSPPKLIKTVNPRFPQVRNQAHYLVTLEFLVDKNGKVKNIHEVGQQDEYFVEAAEDAVCQWEFEPGLKDGSKVDTHIHVTIPFKTVTKENRPANFSP